MQPDGNAKSANMKIAIMRIMSLLQKYAKLFLTYTKLSMFMV